MIDSKTVFYLPNCDTSLRVIKEAGIGKEFTFRDVKKAPLNEDEIDALAVLAGSYEALFSRNAKKYRERKLQNEYLNEKDYRDLLLDHYTFLKRPVIVFDDHIFIGGNEKVVNQLMYHLDNN